MAQLQAELDLERQNSASVVAEKLALREHLSGIVDRLRPKVAAAERGTSSDPLVDLPVPLQEIREAEDIIERTSEYGASDYGGSRKVSAEYTRAVSLDAWGTSGTVSNRDNMTAGRPQSSLATDLLDRHSFQREAQQDVAVSKKGQDSSMHPTVPDTAAKNAEGPPTSESQDQRLG